MRNAAPSYDVAVTLTGGTSVQEFAKVFDGLQSLAERDVINLQFKPIRDRGDPRLLHITVRDAAGKKRNLLVGVADDLSAPDVELLRDIDVYFKRSFEPSRLSGLSPDMAGKVQPLGLNNPIIRMSTSLRILRTRARTGRSLAELPTDARQLFATPPPAAFEVPPETPAEPMVLFQTRLWSPATQDPGRDEINEERATLIRALRSHFGARFIGGAVPSDFVRARFPDAITSLPSSMRAWPHILRRPLIAVYSRGLRDSLAFKMSEYLAASRCIVGHAPRTELPHPLISGMHFLPFRNADECIAQCEQLLARPAEAAAMRRANWSYYRAHVEPAAHMQDVLARAFGG